MVFPRFLIRETLQQTERDLTRFDLDFDLPDHFLPEFPAPIYLTTRLDLGDVSRGKLVTLSNFTALFKNILERGSQVHFMAEFQALLDFPPAPKLDVFGKLDPARASADELRGQALFFGKGRCATCHAPPYYTDNLMHNLKVERFFTVVTINGRKASADGPIKTFPLRGIKDSPPYLHDGRLLTLDDTVEFFNLVLQLKLDHQEKADLVAFMRAL